MYTSRNFRSKKELKKAVEMWNEYSRIRSELITHNPTVHADVALEVEPVTLYAPGLGSPRDNGIEFVEGPHYPAPHTWYAQVTVVDGIVVSVK
jgi:hypothetical protein